MRKRFGLFLALVLAGGVLVPSPGKAAPCTTPLIPCVQQYANDRMIGVYNTIKQPFALVAYPMKYLIPTETFLPGDVPGMYVNTSQAVASNGCDPYPPTSGSCHEYWASKRFSSTRTGAYKFSFTIYFWTDSANKYITSTQVRCRDYPSGSRWSVDTPCFTGADQYANPTINWDAHWNYKQSFCPAGPSIYSYEDLYAKANANRSVSGTLYHYESAGC